MDASVRALFTLLFVLFAGPACAVDQIDYFCIFSNAAAAQADGPVGAFWNGTNWDTSTTFPGITVSTPAALINGISTLTGFWIIVSRAVDSSALDADTNCIMTLDRDVGSVNGNFVLAAAITGTARTNLTFHPIPLGSGYPSPLGK